jgi:hypothetical protein
MGCETAGDPKTEAAELVSLTRHLLVLHLDSEHCAAPRPAVCIPRHHQIVLFKEHLLVQDKFVLCRQMFQVTYNAAEGYKTGTK